jgi:hemolysin III
MSLIWGGALVGMAQCLFFSRAPKALAATLYVALGWASLPFMSQFQAVLPPVDLALIVVGGIVYSLGVSLCAVAVE